MKKYKILIYFFLILIQTTYSYSQNIAYANLDLIIQNSEVGKKIISYFSDKNEKMINEFKANEKIISKAIQSKCGLIIVHRHPSSKNLHEKMEYKDVVKEVNLQLNNQVSKLINLGIHESQIAIDPGLGFGKKMEDSARLLLKIEHLAGELPIVVGYSNKRFLDLISLSKEALLDHCYNSGVSLVRLHIDK